ncbi:MAG: hypothetical protein J6K61_02090 [Clostridia bacterium]|nr:hypothetical protein [Clostridia bacterium]
MSYGRKEALQPKGLVIDMKRFLQLISLILVFGSLLFLLCFVQVNFGEETDSSPSISMGDMHISLPREAFWGIKESFRAIAQFSCVIPTFLTDGPKEVWEAAREVFSSLFTLLNEDEPADAFFV